MNLLLLPILIVIVLFTGAVGSGTNTAALIAAFVFVPAALLLYMFPTFIAYRRGHSMLIPVGIANFFLGWTFFVWVACLAWSFSGNVQRMRHTTRSY